MPTSDEIYETIKDLHGVSLIGWINNERSNFGPEHFDAILRRIEARDTPSLRAFQLLARSTGINAAIEGRRIPLEAVSQVEDALITTGVDPFRIADFVARISTAFNKTQLPETYDEREISVEVSPAVIPPKTPEDYLADFKALLARTEPEGIPTLDTAVECCKLFLLANSMTPTSFAQIAQCPSTSVENAISGKGLSKNIPAAVVSAIEGLMRESPETFSPQEAAAFLTIADPSQPYDRGQSLETVHTVLRHVQDVMQREQQSDTRETGPECERIAQLLGTQIGPQVYGRNGGWQQAATELCVTLRKALDLTKGQIEKRAKMPPGEAELRPGSVSAAERHTATRTPSDIMQAFFHEMERSGHFTADECNAFREFTDPTNIMEWILAFQHPTSSTKEAASKVPAATASLHTVTSSLAQLKSSLSHLATGGEPESDTVLTYLKLCQEGFGLDTHGLASRAHLTDNSVLQAGRNGKDVPNALCCTLEDLLREPGKFLQEEITLFLSVIDPSSRRHGEQSLSVLQQVMTMVIDGTPELDGAAAKAAERQAAEYYRLSDSMYTSLAAQTLTGAQWGSIARLLGTKAATAGITQVAREALGLTRGQVDQLAELKPGTTGLAEKERRVAHSTHAQVGALRHKMEETGLLDATGIAAFSRFTGLEAPPHSTEVLRAKFVLLDKAARIAQSQALSAGTSTVAVPPGGNIVAEKAEPSLPPTPTGGEQVQDPGNQLTPINRPPDGHGPSTPSPG